MAKKKSKPYKKPGPEPETLKLEGDWEENVRKAMSRQRPPEGWPKPEPKPKKKPK